MINKPKNKKKRVLMALSGGIDSAVSTYKLLEQGYEVEAVFMKNYSSQKGLKIDACPWLQDRQDALRVAAFLNIPMHTLNFEKEYEKNVMNYFFKEYKAGRTPNPDVMCNKEIKFKMLYNWAMKNGFDYLATGHYAQIKELPHLLSTVQEVQKNKLKQGIKSSIIKNSLTVKNNSAVLKGAKRTEGSRSFADAQDGRNNMEDRGNNMDDSRNDIEDERSGSKDSKSGKTHQLIRAEDDFKDQTYFIYNIKQSQLPHILFPIGSLKKTTVRSLARKLKLPNAEKKESMGLCFVGKIRLKDFLDQKLKSKSGPIITLDNKKIGQHEGLAYYTVGQRQGIKVGQDGPWFVVSKDMKTNTLVVTNDPDDKSLMVKKIEIHSVNWITRPKKMPAKLLGRYRHQGDLEKIIVTEFGKDHYSVEFSKPQKAIASGQSLVMYDGKICLGGGVIV